VQAGKWQPSVSPSSLTLGIISRHCNIYIYMYFFFVFFQNIAKERLQKKERLQTSATQLKPSLQT
jgi:hypothetical protein